MNYSLIYKCRVCQQVMTLKEDPPINSQTELNQTLQQIINSGAFKVHDCEKGSVGNVTSGMSGIIEVVGFNAFESKKDTSKLILHTNNG